MATVASLLGGLAALLVIAAAARNVYSRTVGRRRDSRRRIARLGTGAQLSFFVSVLRDPPAIRRTVLKERYKRIVTGSDGSTNEVFGTRAFTESIFIDRDYYVQAICDEDETVLAFSVTTRRTRFHPEYALPFRPRWGERRRLKKRVPEYRYEPLVKVKLGRSKFADLGPRADDFTGPRIRLNVGAHNWAYSEIKYLGNPGYYQTVVLTASDAGVPAALGDFAQLRQDVPSYEWPDPEAPESQRDWADMLAAQSFRRATVITTYTVMSADLLLENYHSSFGPHRERVRTLP